MKALKSTLLFCMAGILVSGCAKRIDDIDERVEVLQKRTALLETKGGVPIGSDKELLENQKLADVRSQVAAMRNEMTVISGKMEALEFENKNLQTRIDDLTKEVESKSREEKKSENIKQLTNEATPASSAGGDDKDPEAIYNKALRAHQDGDFEKSQKLFENFVAKFPKNSLADNALYWMGDGYIVKKQYKKAITKFEELIEKYPKSDKRCDALGKQIGALKELKMNKEAAAFTQARNAECSTNSKK